MSTRRAQRLARAREAGAEKPGKGLVPRELRRFHLAHWLPQVPEEATPSDATAEDRAVRRGVTAHRLWQQARDAWATEHGYDLRVSNLRAPSDGHDLQAFDRACELSDLAERGPR